MKHSEYLTCFYTQNYPMFPVLQSKAGLCICLCRDMLLKWMYLYRQMPHLGGNRMDEQSLQTKSQKHRGYIVKPWFMHFIFKSSATGMVVFIFGGFLFCFVCNATQYNVISDTTLIFFGPQIIFEKISVGLGRLKFTYFCSHQNTLTTWFI